MKRAIFELNSFLLKKEFVMASDENFEATIKFLREKEKKDFFTEYLYDNEEPLELAKNTLMNPHFMNNDRVGKVYILSRSITEGQKKSKEKFIEKYFKHPKIELIHVEQKENKFNVVSERNIKWDILFDDELHNINHFVQGEESLEGKTFYIPKFGYNIMPPGYDTYIYSKQGCIKYYDPDNFSPITLKEI